MTDAQKDLNESTAARLGWTLKDDKLHRALRAAYNTRDFADGVMLAAGVTFTNDLFPRSKQRPGAKGTS